MDTTRPFTFAQAQAAGITRRQLGSPRFTTLGRGLYVEGVADLSLRAEALLQSIPGDAHLSHQSAAERWGLWVEPSAEVHVCRQAGKRVQRHGVRSHQCGRHGTSRTPADVWQRGRMAVSAPIVCFLELADVLDLVDLVILGDSLVARGYCSAEELVVAAHDFSGDGAVSARRASEWVRPGSESRQESRTRMLLIAGGLPEPVPNLEVSTLGGRRRRIDLAFAEWKVGAEYEGRQHADSDQQWSSDIMRREELDALGWNLILIQPEGLFVDPMRTIERVTAALRRSGWRGSLKPWPDLHRHFPGRPR
ncbi:hypothetical protein ACMYYO_05575 [Dermacoccaceae bacterium W4C1]